MNREAIKYGAISVGIILVVILLNASLYVVELPNHAIVIQFGKVVATRDAAGLYLKMPFIQTVEKYDTRLREWDGEPSDLLTVDKENIEVNTWARWRVTDPRRYYEALRTESAGQGVLDGIIESSVKNVISAQPLMEVLRNTKRRLVYTSEELEEAEASKNITVSTGREKIVGEILTQAQEKVGADYGFEIDGVAIKHFNYVQPVIPRIYERMRSERIRIANRYKSEGREREAKILGEMQKELETITSRGERESKIIRGRADAEVVRVYAEAYEQDAEFYSFLRSLELLPKALGTETRLVIGSRSSPLFRLLESYVEPPK